MSTLTEARGPQVRSGHPDEIVPTLGDTGRSFSPHDAFAYFKASTHFESLYRAAIDAAGVDLPANPAVLVLRCGAGETAVSPCLRMFREGRIVATDTNAQDLARLRQHLAESGADERVEIRAMATEQLAFADSSFDLVTGVSVLNRLVDPDATLAEAHRLLRPGGYAIFLEPFEGFGLMRLACDQLFSQDALRTDERLTPDLRAALQACAAEIAVRTRPDPSWSGFPELDQKWLFSRENIAKAAEILGYQSARFVTHHDHEHLYRDMLAVLLRQASGAAELDLPPWAWDLLDQFDAALTPSVKRLLLMEATIVLKW